MKRIFLSLLMITSCAGTLLAQQNNSKPGQCTLPLDRSPELRGFRLGTSQAAVLARFPGISLEKPDKFGRTQLRLTVIDMTEFSKNSSSRDKGVQSDTTSGQGTESAFIIDSVRFAVLKGVRRVRLGFLDGRLSFTEVAYDDSIKWTGIDDFVETVAKALNLPVDWSLPPNADGSERARELRCEGFVITADVGADPADTRIAAQLSVEDLAASQLAEKRENDLKQKAQTAEDAKRKNFKP